MGADVDAVSIGRAGLASRRTARVRADDDIVWIKAMMQGMWIFALLGMQLMPACVA